VADDEGAIAGCVGPAGARHGLLPWLYGASEGGGGGEEEEEGEEQEGGGHMGA